MKEGAPKVIVIPAKPEIASQQAIPRQLRVAAYCRVSTGDEEQLTSYEAQKNYYTDKIMTNQTGPWQAFLQTKASQVHLPGSGRNS